MTVRATAPATLVLACGALVKELQAVLELNQIEHMHLECLPATLHMHPEQIPDRLRRRLRETANEYNRVLVGYADCGTSGEIDKVCDEFGATRVPGAHCYEFFASSQQFAALQDAEPGTFYLTDFLARHFDRFVLDGLGITEHPQLLELYFGNYTRLVYLAQTTNTELDRRAQAAANTLGLHYERISTGYGELAEQIVSFA